MNESEKASAMIDTVAQSVSGMLASDALMVMLSMMLGILIGMLWSGNALPRRLPRWMRRESVLRREH